MILEVERGYAGLKFWLCGAEAKAELNWVEAVGMMTDGTVTVLSVDHPADFEYGVWGEISPASYYDALDSLAKVHRIPKVLPSALSAAAKVIKYQRPDGDKPVVGGGS